MRCFFLITLLLVTGFHTLESAHAQSTESATAQAANPEAHGAPGCQSNSDCPLGQVCEGEGCPGDGSHGQCVDPNRPCTMDVATYCGCNGKEFYGSGSCPNARYVRKGQCLESGLPEVLSRRAP
ncbi:hypothetical protein [Ferrimonas gelatinilytica]|uniref:Kazal-type serine protease inhibitor domain-containing protein n=1 Tax=Ferrimonas gelatinilytica TaxID=1255257 RepID=A0ABP9SHG3_9GAMM